MSKLADGGKRLVTDLSVLFVVCLLIDACASTRAGSGALNTSSGKARWIDREAAWEAASDGAINEPTVRSMRTLPLNQCAGPCRKLVNQFFLSSFNERRYFRLNTRRPFAFRKDSRSRRRWLRHVVHQIDKERACNLREAARTENQPPGTRASSATPHRHSRCRARYRAKG